MPRPLAQPVTAPLPDNLTPESLADRWVTPKACQEIIAQVTGIVVGDRVLAEAWPELEWRLINGRRYTRAGQALTAALRRIDTAPLASASKSALGQAA